MKASPRIRFNKEGSVLAASANENRIKILATVDGILLMRTYESHSVIASRAASDFLKKVTFINCIPWQILLLYLF